MERPEPKDQAPGPPGPPLASTLPPELAAAIASASACCCFLLGVNKLDLRLFFLDEVGVELGVGSSFCESGC